MVNMGNPHIKEAWSWVVAIALMNVKVNAIGLYLLENCTIYLRTSQYLRSSQDLGPIDVVPARQWWIHYYELQVGNQGQQLLEEGIRSVDVLRVHAANVHSGIP